MVKSLIFKRTRYANSIIFHSLFDSSLVYGLSDNQLKRRQPGAYKCPFQFIENHKNRMSSFMIFLYRNLVVVMSEKLKVDPSIIDYNLTRLDECVSTVVNKRVREFPSEKQYPYHRAFFRVEEWQIALEFFLQFDGEHCY